MRKNRKLLDLMLVMIAASVLVFAFVPPAAPTARAAFPRLGQSAPPPFIPIALPTRPTECEHRFQSNCSYCRENHGACPLTVEHSYSCIRCGMSSRVPFPVSQSGARSRNVIEQPQVDPTPRSNLPARDFTFAPPS